MARSARRWELLAIAAGKGNKTFRDGATRYAVCPICRGAGLKANRVCGTCGGEGYSLYVRPARPGLKRTTGHDQTLTLL